MGKRSNKKIAVAAGIVVILTAAYFLLSKEPQTNDTNISTPVNSVATPASSDCSDFTIPTSAANGAGWSVYGRKELCLTLEYPEGWSVEDGQSDAVVVRRAEHIDRTQPVDEAELTWVGVTRVVNTTLLAAMGWTDEKISASKVTDNLSCYEEGVVAGTTSRQCLVLTDAKSGYSCSGSRSECVRLTADGRRAYSLTYRTRTDGSDKELIEKIVSTVKIR